MDQLLEDEEELEHGFATADGLVAQVCRQLCKSIIILSLSAV
jgi:hypothetical protein